MKIVIAPDSFKESLSAEKCCQAIKAGFSTLFPDAHYICLPIADGGEGTVDAMVAATGGNEWSYQIGTNADYDANEKRIVAWSGNDLYILNRNGRLIYNNKMSDTVQFASVGDEYVAVFVGDADNGVVSVINGSGQIVDNITVSDQTLLDIGFFMASTTSNAQPIELMWVLGLNTTGTVISTELQTFQPGKLSTGKSSIGEHIAYSIYDENGTLNVVTTRQILHYSYRALEASSPTLIYGYTVEDVKQNGSVLYQLLVPAQEQNEGISIANVRLMYGSVDRVIHLPSACIAARLGTKSVYGFSQNAVYVCSFGETTFRAYALPINVTAAIEEAKQSDTWKEFTHNAAYDERPIPAPGEETAEFCHNEYKDLHDYMVEQGTLVKDYDDLK